MSAGLVLEYGRGLETHKNLCSASRRKENRYNNAGDVHTKSFVSGSGTSADTPDVIRKSNQQIFQTSATGMLLQEAPSSGRGGLTTALTAGALSTFTLQVVMTDLWIGAGESRPLPVMTLKKLDVPLCHCFSPRLPELRGTAWGELQWNMSCQSWLLGRSVVKELPAWADALDNTVEISM